MRVTSVLVSFESSRPGTEEACHTPKPLASSPILPVLLASPWLVLWCLAREVLQLCGIYTEVKQGLMSRLSSKVRCSEPVYPSSPLKKDCGCSENIFKHWMPVIRACCPPIPCPKHPSLVKRQFQGVLSGKPQQHTYSRKYRTGGLSRLLYLRELRTCKTRLFVNCEAGTESPSASTCRGRKIGSVRTPAILRP